MSDEKKSTFGAAAQRASVLVRGRAGKEENMALELMAEVQ
jgi:hypothetical protein